MHYPAITDYISALENPIGIFRTLGEVAVDRDIYGEVKLRAGNSAVVFTYWAEGKRRLMKCYIRPNPRLRAIYRYITDHGTMLLPRIRVLEQELYVHTLSGGGYWVDIVEGEWIEGETLDVKIARACQNGDSQQLNALAKRFEELCRDLLRQEWAHGDLKPENIVVSSDGRMTLIDCDAMWLPEFTGQRAVELGTPAYRHPLRSASHFDSRVDDYPMMLIWVSLRAIAVEPSLFKQHNTTDNIIFSPTELVEHRSVAYTQVAEMFSRNAMARELRVLEACCLPEPVIDNAQQYFELCLPAPSDELTAAVVNGKWGFVDGGGEIRIKPFWDEVLEFRNLIAAVRLGRWWHFIDPSGGVVESGLDEEHMIDRLHAQRTAVGALSDQ